MAFKKFDPAKNCYNCLQDLPPEVIEINGRYDRDLITEEEWIKQLGALPFPEGRDRCELCAQKLPKKLMRKWGLI